MPEEGVWVLEKVTPMLDLERTSAEREGLDRLVCGILGTMGLVCFQHIPSLAKHMGQSSTLNHKDNPGKEAVGFSPLFIATWLKAGPR